MNTNELTKKGLSIDDWITIFRKRVKNTDSEEKITEFNDTIDFLSHVKNKIDNIDTSVVSERVLYCMKYVCDSFTASFDTWECEIIHYNTHIVLCNDIIFIEISDIGLGVECSVSFNYQANPVVVSEITLMLHNIFGVGFNILMDVFMKNPLNNDYIWGEDNIRLYKKESQPLKLNQIVIFGEEGNC